MKHTGLLREVGRTVSKQVEIHEKIDGLSLLCWINVG